MGEEPAVSSVSHRGFTHLGLDVSKDSISVAVLEPESDRAAVRKVFHDESSVRRLIAGSADRSTSRSIPVTAPLPASTTRPVRQASTRRSRAH
jgi:hypothetical protein